MALENKKFKDQFYLILAGIFIASLVTCNLIANKFVKASTDLEDSPEETAVN